MNLIKSLGPALTVLLAISVSAGLAAAEPLVTMEGGGAKPGVVTAWSGSGKKIELVLKDGSDAQAVAASIKANVDGVRTKIRGGKVLVIGKTQADLLAALAEVDFGGDDDMDLLASAAMEDDLDSGSSLRAKKTTNLKKLMKDRATVAQGKVVSVKTGKYPQARVSVRILSGPTGPLGRKVRKGKTIVFTPLLKMAKGSPAMSDPNTQTNLGAYYLQKGDRVKIKIGQPLKGGYEAVLITR